MYRRQLSIVMKSLGVPADQRLVGTDAHRKYVEKWFLEVSREGSL